jgi:hypothetical protein
MLHSDIWWSSINKMQMPLVRQETKLLKSGDPLTMGYFDNLDNVLLNKYKKNLKNEKNL